MKQNQYITFENTTDDDYDELSKMETHHQQTARSIDTKSFHPLHTNENDKEETSSVPEKNVY